MCPVEGVFDNHLGRHFDGLGKAGKDLVGPLEVIEHVGQLADFEITYQGEDEAAPYQRRILGNTVRTPAFASQRDAMPVVRTSKHPGIEQFPAHAQVRTAMRANCIVNVDLGATAYDQQAAVTDRNRADIRLKITLEGNLVPSAVAHQLPPDRLGKCLPKVRTAR